MRADGHQVSTSTIQLGHPPSKSTLFRHTYNALRPCQALDERIPRAAYLAVQTLRSAGGLGGSAS